MPGRVLALTGLVLLAGFVLLLRVTPASAEVTVPEGFEETAVTSVESPTALAFKPDGDMLVTSKSGQVRVYKDGALLQTPALDLSSQICDNVERGLLGIAVDPNFGKVLDGKTNDYVYLHYNYKKYGNCKLNAEDGPVNRVSRFEMVGDVIDPTSEKVLLDNIPAPNGHHDGGDVKFGKDGYLYVSVGDGSCDYLRDSGCGGQNDAARDRNVLSGKILRITSEGGIPSDNPFMGASSEPCGIEGGDGRTDPGKVCQETYAWGLRNPFRMAFDPDAGGTSFRIHDVGQATWEEINRGEVGADYGWNCREGAHLNPLRGGKCNPLPGGMVDPIHEYNHKSGCESVTGGAFVPNGVWPASFDRAYLFGDYVCNKIFNLTPRDDGGGFVKTPFATGLGPGGPISLTFGPDGAEEALYYTTFAGGGQVRRIAYTDGNQAPVADIKGNQLWSENLTINFDGSGSTDPDGNTPLTYFWDFDSDGTTDQTTSSSTTTHTYATSAKYTATLRVKDNLGKLSGPHTIEVFPGNTPPATPVIESPAQGALFSVGESITLAGSAVDPEDGQLANSKLSWKVLQWHDGNHTHPYATLTGNNVTLSAPAPEELGSTDPMGNYLEIGLTAKDSQGLLSETVVRVVRPKTVEVGFETLPIALRLRVNGITFRAPRTFVSWEGYELNVSAARQRDKRGRIWKFVSWSDGGAADHKITTPSEPATYTATFKRVKR